MQVTWDAVAQRFRYAGSGRFVGRVAIRVAFEQSLENVGRGTDTLMDDLRAGRLSLLQFREEMRSVIKQTHMAALELARGGRAQTSLADYGRAGQRMRVDYAYLDRWVADIAAGGPLDDRLEPRGRQYLRSARSAYLAHQEASLRSRGFDQIRSVLHPAEHCAECIAEAARGFVAIGSHIPIGRRQCRHNDQCTAEYRNSSNGEVLAA